MPPLGAQSQIRQTPEFPDILANQLWNVLYGAQGPGPSPASEAVRRFGWEKAARFLESPLFQLALGGGGGVERGAPQGAKLLYHGTPHEFAPTPRNPLGEFDLGKIGTGEGAQAYGHGIYLAENPGVARSYMSGSQPPHRPTSISYGGKNYEPGSDRAFVLEQVNRRGRREVVEQLIRDAEKYADESDPVEVALRDDLLNMARWAKTIRPDDVRLGYGGKLLKVHLPDEHIARMLDWDALLRGQPEAVRQTFAEFAPGDYQRWLSDPTATGQHLYRIMSGRLDTEHNGTLPAPAKASEYLGGKGVPGLRYLDQGSRMVGQGTRNYVVWDPSILRILGAE